MKRTRPLLLSLRSLPILQVLSVRLESGNDVQRRSIGSASSGLDRSSVHHQSRSVQSPESLHHPVIKHGATRSAESRGGKPLRRKRYTDHKGSRHVLVATGDDDHSVEPMSSSGGLDLVSNEVSGLELCDWGARKGGGGKLSKFGRRRGVEDMMWKSQSRAGNEESDQLKLTDKMELAESGKKEVRERVRTEYDIPKVPIEIPSETPTVPNW
jgi:hypothetical protein